MGLNLFPFYIPWQCLQYSTKASPPQREGTTGSVGRGCKSTQQNWDPEKWSWSSPSNRKQHHLSRPATLRTLICVDLWVYTDVCLCMYIYIYIHICVCVYTYTYTRQGVSMTGGLCTWAFLQRISGKLALLLAHFLIGVGRRAAGQPRPNTFQLAACMAISKKRDEKWMKFCLSLKGGRGEGKLIPSPFELAGLVRLGTHLRKAERDLNLQ